VSKRVVYLTDEQWKRIEPLIPTKPVGRKGSRPSADDRLVFEGILWILGTGARWKELPDRYPHPSTCWRRLKEWYETDVLEETWRTFLSERDATGVLDWEESFIDGSFSPAKKGVRESGKPKGERERSLWWWSMARVFLWEAIPTLLRQQRSGSPRRRSARSKSPKKDREGRGPALKE
jgi:transposase